MREFTQKEKELIINTPITEDCFDLSKTHHFKCYGVNMDKIISLLERQRLLLVNNSEWTDYQRNALLESLIVMLPVSYKVVNLAGTPDLEKLTNGMIQRTC